MPPSVCLLDTVDKDSNFDILHFDMSCAQEYHRYTEIHKVSIHRIGYSFSVNPRDKPKLVLLFVILLSFYIMYFLHQIQTSISQSFCLPRTLFKNHVRKQEPMMDLHILSDPVIDIEKFLNKGFKLF